jgi:hypothetical protein
VKYESWLKINKQHKYNLISKLTTKQYNNFIYQFFTNKKQTEYILLKKFNNLLECNKLRTYNIKELIKMNKIIISSQLSLDVIIKVFDKFNTNNVTEHNVKNLVLYLRDIDNFKCVKVKWGPGNHRDINNNIKQHFNKHVLSKDEGKYWVSILDKIDCKSYENYAIQSFQKMTNIIIHTDGVNIHLSGFYNNTFIIGRYHNNIFGISSCYYVNSGEKLGRYKGLCLKL